MEPNAMNEVGKAISSSFAFVSRVGQECEALANLLKQEVSSLLKESPLHERYIPGEWVHSYKTDEHGWIFTDAAWSLPLVPKGKRKVAAYLSFQMSFLCDNSEGGMSPEPLLHVNFWDDAVQFEDENYMGFPIGGITDSALADLQIGVARLFRWEGNNGGDDRWTYTVNLADINGVEDVRRLVGRPVVPLLISVADGQTALKQLKEVVSYVAAEDMPDYYRVVL
jgi:hypothetical protein